MPQCGTRRRNRGEWICLGSGYMQSLLSSWSTTLSVPSRHQFIKHCCRSMTTSTALGTGLSLHLATKKLDEEYTLWNSNFSRNKKESKITKENIHSSLFLHFFDGRFNGTIKGLPKLQCKYCNYLWKNEFNSKQQKDYGFMESNKTSMVHCLVCNVNLCPNCISEWHGVDMQDTNSLLG